MKLSNDLDQCILISYIRYISNNLLIFDSTKSILVGAIIKMSFLIRNALDAVTAATHLFVAITCFFL